MVIALAKESSARLLKHVVRCYLRLSDNQRWVYQNMIAMHIVCNFTYFCKINRIGLARRSASAFPTS